MCEEPKKSAQDRDIKTLYTFTPLHTWSIAALSGHDCLIVHFRKLQKLSQLLLIPVLERGFHLKHMAHWE